MEQKSGNLFCDPIVCIIHILKSRDAPFLQGYIFSGTIGIVTQDHSCVEIYYKGILQFYWLENSGWLEIYEFGEVLRLTCKVFGQIFPSNEKIENINDQYWTLRAEEVKFVSFYPVSWCLLGRTWVIFSKPGIRILSIMYTILIWIDINMCGRIRVGVMLRLKDVW
jgi:hypothetical protein